MNYEKNSVKVAGILNANICGQCQMLLGREGFYLHGNCGGVGGVVHGDYGQKDFVKDLRRNK